MCSFVAISSFNVCNFSPCLCFLANVWRYSCALPLFCHPVSCAHTQSSFDSESQKSCWLLLLRTLILLCGRLVPTWHLLLPTVLWGNCCPSSTPCACVFGSEYWGCSRPVRISWVFFQSLYTTSGSMQKFCYLALGRNQVGTETRRTQNNYLLFQ